MLNSSQLIAGLGDQVRNSLNVRKPQYTRASQTDGGEVGSTTENQTLNGRERRKPFLRIVCHLLLVCIVVGFILSLTITWKHNEDSSDDPDLPDRPLPGHPSPVPPIPSDTPSNPPSNPPSDPPEDSPKHPDEPKQPENPNAPGHLPDGSSCGADCVVASYQWPIDDYLRSFSFFQSGLLTSGHAYIKRSRSAGPGNFYVSLELTGIKMSDITLIFSPSRSSSGTSVVLSTPRAISPFSWIKANITIELPLDTMDSFQDFSFIAQNTNVAFEETDDSNTFNISKLEVSTTNADIILSPLFTTAAGLEVQTRNGDISGIARSKGKVEISNANGDIDLDVVGDTANVYTTNADLTGEYVCPTKCELQTTSGDLNIRKIQTINLVLDNKNGKIDVRNISSVFNLVSSGSNAAMKLQVQSVIPGAMIVLANKNDAVDLTMVSVQSFGKFSIMYWLVFYGIMIANLICHFFSPWSIEAVSICRPLKAISLKPDWSTPQIPGIL
jgi:Putative adhesin